MVDTDNKELEERCERCEHFHGLKHNFKAGIGFEESNCCDVLLHLPDSTDDIKAWVQEVSRLDICEMFTEAKQNEKAKPQEQEPILDKIFCMIHPLSIMSTPELEHKAIMQIAEMLEPLCLPESEDI